MLMFWGGDALEGAKWVKQGYSGGELWAPLASDHPPQCPRGCTNKQTNKQSSVQNACLVPSSKHNATLGYDISTTPSSKYINYANICAISSIYSKIITQYILFSFHSSSEP